MNLAKLSDKTLELLAAGKAIDYGGLPDEELQELTKHQRQPAGQTPSLAIPDIVEEQSPYVTTADRLILQNLSNSPQAQAEYMARKPGVEARVYRDRALFRQEGEQQYRPIDPDTGVSLKDALKTAMLVANPFLGLAAKLHKDNELLSDVGDVAYDIPAGFASGVATTAGGTMGALAGGPAGALAGGAAAGGASSAGLEYARQKLGQLAGVPQDVDAGQVAIAGAVGGALPVAGAGLKAGYQGFRSRVAPWLGEKMSGVPREMINALKRRFEDVENLERGGVTEYLRSAQRKLKGGLAEETKQVGQQLQATGEAVETINVAGAKSRLGALVDDLRARFEASPTEANRVEYEAAQSQYNEIFTIKKPAQPASELLGPDGNPVTAAVEETLEEIPDMVSGAQAMHLREQLKAAAGLFKVGTGPQARHGVAATGTSKRVSNAFADEYKQIGEGLSAESSQAAAHGVNAPPSFGDIADDYGEVVGFAKELQKPFGSKRATYNTLSNLDKPGQTVTREQLETLAAPRPGGYGIDLLKEAETLGAYRVFGKPSSAPISSFGTTSTSRTIPAAIMGGSIGSLLGFKLGGGYAGAVAGGGVGAGLGANLGSPAMVKKLVRMGRWGDKYGAHLREPAYAIANPAAQGTWNRLRERR